MYKNHNNNAEIITLSPVDGRKSFYGKAYAEVIDGVFTLYSYGVRICETDGVTFRRIWSRYSATTMRHINAFLDLCGLSGGGKSWWDKLETSGAYDAETWERLEESAETDAENTLDLAA